ncbi:MAG: SAM-dependent methyltransferase [Bdellovibrio sp. CG10_big_fil_rev_8_21_14_0_10_47_8]|nr:MAG: SAM-dependent methyltransferase [Bdellovibrio sp. CG10_big_fil_rev_8_21_14_0_10_47_8]
MPFTYFYSQPSEYRFSLDSIEMAWAVAQYLQESRPDLNLSQCQALDLCAGCGVIGFELNFHLPSLEKIDFVEVQSEYLPHFEQNLKMAEQKRQKSLPFEFINKNYQDLVEAKPSKRYQLILCNPPYFLPEQGKMSPSDFKNRCRFFLDSSFEKLIECLISSLAMDGEAFLLLRPLEDHGHDLLSDLKKLIKGTIQCENLAMVRGTFLLRLYH